MSQFLRKLREFIVRTDEGEEFPPTLPMADEVQDTLTYKGTIYLYEGLTWAGKKIYYTAPRPIEDTQDKCIGKTSVTFLLGKEIDWEYLHREPTKGELHLNWLQDLKNGVEKREALIKKVGKAYE